MSEQTPALPDTATWCAAARQWFDSHFERRVAGDENDHGRPCFTISTRAPSGRCSMPFVPTAASGTTQATAH